MMGAAFILMPHFYSVWPFQVDTAHLFFAGSRLYCLPKYLCMNFKPNWMLCCLLITSLTALSQENETDASNVTRVTVFNPGLSYEARIARSQTVYVQGFMNMSGYFSYS